MARLVRVWLPIHLILLVVGYGALWRAAFLPADAILALWIFLPVGLLGGLLSNATGIGGGVVFLPVLAAVQVGAIAIAPEFEVLARFGTPQAVAVSFCIQCFGLSAGALGWAWGIFVRDRVPWNEKVPDSTLQTVFFAPLALGLPALLLTQVFLFRQIDGNGLLAWYAVASLILGIVLLVFAWTQGSIRASDRRLLISRVDLVALLLIGAAGGVATALTSVGIGVFVAVWLLLRRYPSAVAIAGAVWVSLVFALAGVWFPLAEGLLQPEVALVAIPGALIGGLLGRPVASALGVVWLKSLAGFWIAAAALYLLLFV